MSISERNYGLMNNISNKYISNIQKVGAEFIPCNIESLRNEEIINGLSLMGFWHKRTEERLTELKDLTEKWNSEITEYLKDE